MTSRILYAAIFVFVSACQIRCQEDRGPQKTDEEPQSFYFGADLSYANQILDKGGVYKDDGQVKSPYRIFADHGANLVRLRLWHNPQWTKEVYGSAGTKLYNDLKDVEKAIAEARASGLQVLLDFHYSDNWADPGRQEIPAAWGSITDVAVLKDSVYRYTSRALSYLNAKGLMPELVQIGNETNCGMLYTKAQAGFPAGEVCNAGQWQRLGDIVKSAIQAVRDVADQSAVKTKVILHVADPKNVEWWFDHITGTGNVIGFDIIGFSYYPLWHRTVSVDALSESVRRFKSKYARPVMILETAYPWTTEAHDSYANHFGNEPPITGYPFSVQGQSDMMKKIAQELFDGGGAGIVYWEPAWISVPALKDQWGTGSSWESNTLFDFEGNTLSSIEFMTHDYQKK